MGSLAGRGVSASGSAPPHPGIPLSACACYSLFYLPVTGHGVQVSRMNRSGLLTSLLFCGFCSSMAGTLFLRCLMHGLELDVAWVARLLTLSPYGSGILASGMFKLGEILGST